MVIWRFVGVLLLAGALHAQPVTYFRTPQAITGGIAVGPDGNFWFPTVGGIVRMTPSGEMTLFPTPTPISGGYSSITAGPDGRMWFMSQMDGRIGAITTGGVVTEYPVPAGTFLRGITAGADGNLWFGYQAGVGRITPAGAITFFPLPQPREVIDLVLGFDGNVWFVQWPFNHVGRITPAGAITLFPVTPGFSPIGIARGSDGALWTSLHLSRELLRVNADGSFTRHDPLGVPTNNPPDDVEAGPDATIWFSIDGRPQLGRIRPNGEVVLIPLDEHHIGEVRGMVAGPDGNLWAVVRPNPRLCIPVPDLCPPDPVPPVGIARVNLIAPAVNNVPIPALSGSALVVMAVALAAAALAAMRFTS